MAKGKGLGELAVERGFLTRGELEDALRAQAELFQDGTDKPLGEILVEKGYIRQTQLDALVQAQEEAGKKRIGPYELVARLGEGGMGAVYKARDERTGQFIALKILPRRFAQDAEYVKRFQREGRLGLKLDHPNVVRTLEVDEGEGPGGGRYHYMAIEYIEGPDLDKVLEKRVRLPEREALDIALAVARALQHAQEHELVHRDIKPANIMLARDGRILLTDLGLARSTAEDATRFTVTGQALGTPNYISPEQALGEKDIDIRTDIYSLGGTLYRMLTGKAPFAGGTAAVVVAKHLTEELTNPRDMVPGLSEAVCGLITRMMAKKPKDRHAGPAELIADIERVLGGQSPAMTLDLGLSSIGAPAASIAEGPAPSVAEGAALDTAGTRVGRDSEEATAVQKPRETREPETRARARRRAETVRAVRAVRRRKKRLVLAGIAAGCGVVVIGALIAVLAGREDQPDEPSAGLAEAKPRALPVPETRERIRLAAKPAVETREIPAAPAEVEQPGQEDSRDVPLPEATTAKVEERAPAPKVEEPAPAPPLAEVEESAPEAQPSRVTEAEPAPPAPTPPPDKPFEIPSGFKKAVIFGEDFESGRWRHFASGPAIPEPPSIVSESGRRNNYLRLGRLHRNKYFAVGASHGGSMAASKDTRASLRYLSVRHPIKVQVCLREKTGSVANYGMRLDPGPGWRLADFSLLEMTPNVGPVDMDALRAIAGFALYGGKPGVESEVYIDDFEVYDVVPMTPRELLADRAKRKRLEALAKLEERKRAREAERQRKKRETERNRREKEAERTMKDEDAREWKEGYLPFLDDFSALLKERAYDRAAKLAEDWADERGEEHARAARLLKGYLGRALKNAKAATGKRVKVRGIRGKLVKVEGEEITVRTPVGEIALPFSDLKWDETVAFAELDPPSRAVAASAGEGPPPERFAMRGLFCYAEGNIEQAAKEVRGAKGELADRVRWLVALVRAETAPATPAVPPGPAEHRKPAGPAPTITVDLGGGVAMEMVHIKPGRFMMGSNAGQSDEKPVHEVVITQGFYLGKFEVTQEQYQVVVETNPSRLKGAKNPVEQVSWNSAVEFCRRLSQRMGRQVRLPTEAEWEYACRAGSTGKYCFGDDEGRLGEYAWYRSNAGGQTHPAGLKRPNAWGLYDMHGNVWEWCADWYDSGYYGKSPRADPKGFTSGKYRVLRGGSWKGGAGRCRSAFRCGYTPSSRLHFGFRVVLTPSTREAEASPAPGQPEIKSGPKLSRVQPPSEQRKLIRQYGFESRIGWSTNPPAKRVRDENPDRGMVLESVTYRDHTILNLDMEEMFVLNGRLRFSLLLKTTRQGSFGLGVASIRKKRSRALASRSPQPGKWTRVVLRPSDFPWWVQDAKDASEYVRMPDGVPVDRFKVGGPGLFWIDELQIWEAVRKPLKLFEAPAFSKKEGWAGGKWLSAAYGGEVTKAVEALVPRGAERKRATTTRFALRVGPETRTHMEFKTSGFIEPTLEFKAHDRTYSLSLGTTTKWWDAVDVAVSALGLPQGTYVGQLSVSVPSHGDIYVRHLVVYDGLPGSFSGRILDAKKGQR